MLLITNPIQATILNATGTSEKPLLLLFRSYSYVDTAVLRRGRFEHFRPGLVFWHRCHVDQNREIISGK